jgi:hypothetical protein
MGHIQSQNDEVIDLTYAAPESRKTSFAGFLMWCGTIVALGSLAVAAFIALVDPYRVVGLVDAKGFNSVKPLPEQYREQIKVVQASRLRPDVLLLGNSRIEVGFDPESGPLRSHGYVSAYNLGLAGTSLTSSYRVFEQVRNNAAPPAMAVIGVEFLDFLVQPNAPAQAANHSQPMSWQWRVDTFFSLKAISDALRTLRIQRADEAETLTPLGHNPLREYRQYVRQEGYHAIFQQRGQENAKNLIRKPHNLRQSPGGSSESIDRLRDLLETMARDGTKVDLIIYPYHAELMAMFEETGLQGTMDEWKHLLLRVVEDVRRQQPASRITLWDFSGYGPFQCEDIPLTGDVKSSTTWYWEAGHFKSALGDLMQRRILGEEMTFGVPLTAENFEHNRQRIAAERTRCAASVPEIFTGARTLVDNARKQAH